MSEAKNWEKIKNGDHQAFENLYKHSINELLRYGKRFSLDQGLVEDAIQEVFISVWKNRQALPVLNKPIKYLYRATRNALLKRIQRTEKRYTSPPDIENFDIVLAVDHQLIQNESEKEQKNKLQQAIANLSARQKEVLYLKYQKGFTNEEITSIMDINYQSVRNTLSRAIQKLRAELTIFIWLFIYFFL